MKMFIRQQMFKRVQELYQEQPDYTQITGYHKPLQAHMSELHTI